jgi:hypothetical protein
MLLVVRPKRLRGRDAHSVAKSTGKFLTAPTAPKKFGKSVLLFFLDNKSFYFFSEEKHRVKMILKKCKAAFKFEVMCDTFSCVLRAL